ncbi:adenylyl-sulfate kinase [Nostoc sp. RF31YmG]|nr:adenylyl-sulfate kinase [Nostoc sp. RF31YmG]
MQDNYQGLTIWLTGLSGAGKTTIGKAIVEELLYQNQKVSLLDGDNLRQTLCKGLGFSSSDREENIRRIGCLADSLTREGNIAIVCVISPYRNQREKLKQKIIPFMEVYVNAPLAVCEKRDVKGLYKKAHSGEIINFTGIDDPYEYPLNPDVECKTDCETIDECVNKILTKAKNLGFINLSC